MEEGVEAVGGVGGVEVAADVEAGALDGEGLVGGEEGVEAGNDFWWKSVLLLHRRDRKCIYGVKIYEEQQCWFYLLSGYWQGPYTLLLRTTRAGMLNDLA